MVAKGIINFPSIRQMECHHYMCDVRQLVARDIITVLHEIATLQVRLVKNACLLLHLEAFQDIFGDIHLYVLFAHQL